MSRSHDRSGFEHPVRVQLLEHDVDELESTLEERLDKLEDRIAGLTKTGVAILVSLATTGMLLAVNVWLVMAR